ncbi:ATP-dependent nuclease [Chryseobacterium cheonjiense]|jgi:predicted ATP-dependent endonuclease of OLD family|uniref:AAA family ATPase n=1 Tax=Chryseobacterium cheonjiense TaxID=2728845 RepID=A0A7Y0A9N8_9FLAO|nr:AAA family ATPase [Chryseobacterium cheonjiense]NML59240.1 AAA family ATPase [Chryseobacterium cheonjiense]
MYISKISIEGFRNFPHNEILFNDGVNVIIGHNNSGKTSLIKAISLVINSESSRRLEMDDFSKSLTLEQLKNNPPAVTITLTFKKSIDEPANSEDLVTVSDWLTVLNADYEAKLTYRFFLPVDKHDEYETALADCETKDKAWQVIKQDYLRFYTYKIYGGDPTLLQTADSDSLQKFDFQFLNAIRDVERDMFTGRNTMLREILDFFLDYDIKSTDEAVKSNEEKVAEIKAAKQVFSDQAAALITELQRRMRAGKDQILNYARQTGATFNNATPDFDGGISEVELFSALKLIIGYAGLDIKIPATHNGLGYNNLIYMSLLLAKMQVNSDGKYLGSNAKVFPVLAIEEPEAHLHPSMQYKFLKFLKENRLERKVRQIFVTTHSTQITSAVSLDDIICLHNLGNEIVAGYPGKCFADNDEGRESKAYVQRFLDATRSDMLFAQKVIFVEGLAEQVLLPTLTKYIDIDIADHHIAIVPVGGRYFDHFLQIFDSTRPFTIPKMVLVLKDRDPERKRKAGGSFGKCYTFDVGQNAALYDYRNHIEDKLETYQAHPNIRFFGQNHKNGKTFEYELMLSNLQNDILLTRSISNKDELNDLIQWYNDGRPEVDLLNRMRDSPASRTFRAALEGLADNTWTQQERKEVILAFRYLSSVGKGENALELATLLEENLLLPEMAVNPEDKTRKIFNVPDYIQQAIHWICQ